MYNTTHPMSLTKRVTHPMSLTQRCLPAISDSLSGSSARRVRRVPLHVLEVEEVLAPLSHHLQVGQKVQKLGEFLLHLGIRREEKSLMTI